MIKGATQVHTEYTWEHQARKREQVKTFSTHILKAYTTQRLTKGTETNLPNIHNPPLQDTANKLLPAWARFFYVKVSLSLSLFTVWIAA